MTVAVGVVALAVPLVEHRRKLLRKPPRRLASADLGEPILAGGCRVRHIAASDEVAERLSDVLKAVGKEA